MRIINGNILQEVSNAEYYGLRFLKSKFSHLVILFDVFDCLYSQEQYYQKVAKKFLPKLFEESFQNFSRELEIF